MHTVAQHFERSEPQVYAVYDKIVKVARVCCQAYGLAE